MNRVYWIVYYCLPCSLCYINKTMAVNLSTEVSELKGCALKRYLEKITVINGVDPYNIDQSELCLNVDLFPAITYPDIFIT